MVSASGELSLENKSEAKEKKALAEMSVQLLELNQALKFYHGLTQRHSLEFAKEESLDLVHRIVLANHCSVHLLS